MYPPHRTLTAAAALLALAAPALAGDAAALEAQPAAALPSSAVPASDRVGVAFEVTRAVRRVDAFGVSFDAALLPAVGGAPPAGIPKPRGRALPEPGARHAVGATAPDGAAAEPPPRQRSKRERHAAAHGTVRPGSARPASAEAPAASDAAAIPLPAERPLREVQGPAPFRPRNLLEAIFGPPAGRDAR